MIEVIRLELQKKEAASYVGHLDFSRAVERALRRAKLPVAFSVGFNPHMKLSFGPALSVGISSEAEYMDVELEEPCNEADFFQRLSRQLPPGLGLSVARKIQPKKSLAAALNLAEYRVDIHLTEMDEFTAEKANQALLKLQTVNSLLFRRVSPKGNKQIEVLDYLYGNPKWTQTAEAIRLLFQLRLKASGALKPQEFLRALMEQLDFPQGECHFCRVGLHAETEAGVRTAFEI